MEKREKRLILKTNFAADTYSHPLILALYLTFGPKNYM